MASENITDYIKEAFEAKDSGDYKVAIDYFYKALAIDCESSEILLELAGLYVLLFQNERAIDLYEQILSKHPDNFAAKYSYASLLKKIKNFDKALTYFQDLLKAKYDVVTVATKIIDIYFYNGQYQNLVDIFSNNALVLKNSRVSILRTIQVSCGGKSFLLFSLSASTSLAMRSLKKKLISSTVASVSSTTS